jgi:hypothetical protein
VILTIDEGCDGNEEFWIGWKLGIIIIDHHLNVQVELDDSDG